MSTYCIPYELKCIFNKEKCSSPNAIFICYRIYDIDEVCTTPICIKLLKLIRENQHVLTNGHTDMQTFIMHQMMGPNKVTTTLNIIHEIKLQICHYKLFSRLITCRKKIDMDIMDSSKCLF